MKTLPISPLFSVLCISIVVTPGVMSTAMLSLAFGDVSKSFEVSYGVLQWRNVLFFSVFSISILYFGAALNRIGSRRALFFGQFIFVLASLISTVTTNWYLYLIAQSAQALADGMLVPAQMSIIRQLVPKERWGWAFGWFHGTLAAAAMLGPLTGAVLVNEFGWQAIPAVLAGLQLIILCITYLILPRFLEIRQGRLIHPPVTSAVLLFLILCAAQSALQSNISTVQWYFLIAVIAFVVLLNFNERRLINTGGLSLIPWESFQNAEFRHAILRIFLVFIVSNASVLHIPTGLRAVSDIDVTVIGLAFTLSALMSTFFGPLMGRLADTLGYRALISGLVGLSIASASFYFLSAWGGAVTLLIYCLLGAISGGLFGPAQLKIASVCVANQDRDRFMSFYMFCQFISGAFAASLLGLVMQDRSAGGITMHSFQNYTTIVVCALTLATGSALVSHREAKLRAVKRDN